MDMLELFVFDYGTLTMYYRERIKPGEAPMIFGLYLAERPIKRSTIKI